MHYIWNIPFTLLKIHFCILYTNFCFNLASIESFISFLLCFIHFVLDTISVYSAKPLRHLYNSSAHKNGMRIQFCHRRAWSDVPLRKDTCLWHLLYTQHNIAHLFHPSFQWRRSRYIKREKRRLLHNLLMPQMRSIQFTVMPSLGYRDSHGTYRQRTSLGRYKCG